jgi:voltage-gated potassium channel Kch
MCARKPKQANHEPRVNHRPRLDRFRLWRHGNFRVASIAGALRGIHFGGGNIGRMRGLAMSNKPKGDAVGLLVAALAIPALLVYLAWAFALWQIDAAAWTVEAPAIPHIVRITSTKQGTPPVVSIASYDTAWASETVRVIGAYLLERCGQSSSLNGCAVI